MQENILVQKLDEFIRKYYKNQLVRGLIYSSGMVLGAFLGLVLLEYFAEFGTAVRTVLFFGFVAATLTVVGKYIVIPLLRLNRIGKVISYDQAAQIIGNHFGNVQDKLLNVLQLQNNRSLNGSGDLLLAGINQKISELRPVPFTGAIDLGENKRYLKYVLPVFILTAAIVTVWPHVISKSTTRLVNYSTYYEKTMPFSFHLNDDLKAIQTNDYRLNVRVSGNEIPDEIYISIGGIEYKLEKDDRLNFHYIFPNVQTSTDFQLSAAGYLSKEYRLEVLPKPSLLQFNIRLVYPAYLNKPAESLLNTGDLQIPQGTKVSWTFNTRNTEQLELKFSDSLVSPEQRGEEQFGYSRRFLQSNHYSIRALNSFVRDQADSVGYSIQVIPDQYPVIDVSEKTDSINPKNIYFSGQLKDDHGFSQLVFHYTRSAADSNGVMVETRGSFPLSLNRAQTSQPYFYFFDAARYQLGPGDQVSYYFEVFDNDGVNGPKAAKTRTMLFRAPDRSEISAATEKNNAEIKNDLEESIKKTRQLQKEISELSRKIQDKKQMGYEEKKKLEDLLKKQQELQNRISEIKQQNEMNNKQRNEFSPADESILEKQKQLEQLFENVMTPEMKKLFDELQKMMDKLDKNQVQEKLEELQLNNKDIEKELDRNLEAFKQLELAQKMQEAVERLEEMRKKQEQLAKETEGKKSGDLKAPADQEKKMDEKGDKEQHDKSGKDAEQADDKKKDTKDKAADLGKKQGELNKAFEELKKDLKELEKKNEQLEEPNKLPETGEKSEEISKDMQNSSEQLDQNNKKGAAKSQKSAAEKMQEMQEQMEQAMAEEEEQQNEENAQSLRQILENLLNLSFSQEELMKELSRTRTDNPKYTEIPKQQKKLKDDSRIIEDSLLALSKRAPQISALVNREISAMNMNMDKTVRFLAERNPGESAMRMQSTMKSANDLALLLNESLEQMQQQMKQQQQSKGGKGGKCKKPGKGSGQNPSSGGKPVSNMRQMQQQLNEQLKQLKEALEKGNKPGEKPGDKTGQKPGGSQGQKGTGGLVPGSSEQFAKMAAQQEALRRQMQELMDKLKNKGRNPGGNIADLMEQTEKDLVNKQINAETMRRQQEILSRLLESEKAEKEREQDEQRKSNEAKNEVLSNPERFLEYKRLKEKEMELLNTVPPGLTPYYKEKVSNYFNNLNK